LFTAVVRVTGAGRIADFREKVRWLLVRDPDAEDYTEHHGGGTLEYRFAPRKGIPFPVFAEASGDFPELRVEAEWERDGVRGRAVIEAGKVVDEERGVPEQPGVDVTAGEQGLELAFVCERSGAQWIGYAARASGHTYFRWDGRSLALVDAGDADPALEDVAFRLVDEWLWYDEEEAPMERARYAQYGLPVRGANLKSEKLALLRRRDNRYSSLEGPAREAREALLRTWRKP
jgi:hypothetical protein